MTRPARLLALAFLICVYLCLSVAKVQAANVRLWNIAPYSTTNSTHQLITEQISTNILSNGGVQAIGLPKRLTPAADGTVTNFYGLGFYAVKDAVTGLGLYVINVYDATTTQYDYTNLLTSGYNTYVVTTIVINTNLSAGLTPAQVGVMIQTSNNAAGLIYTNSFDPTNAAATVNTKLDLNSVNLTNNIANHSTNDPSGAAATVNTKLDLNSVNLTNNIANHSTNDAAGAAATVNTKLDLNSVNLTNNIAAHSTNDAAGSASTVNTKLDLNSVNLTNNIANHSTNDAAGAASTVNTKLDLNSGNLTNNIANHSTNDAAGAASTVNTKLDLNSVNLTNNIANHSTNDPSGAASTVNTKLDLNSVNISNALSVVSGGGILTKNGSGTNTFLTNSPFAQITNLMVVDGVGTATFTPATGRHQTVLGDITAVIDPGATSAFIGGGTGGSINASAMYSFIGGGQGNKITGIDGFHTDTLEGIIAGSQNRIDGSSSGSFIGGGNGNTITNSAYSFSAGSANLISNAQYSVAFGIGGHVQHISSFVWNDIPSTFFATTGTNQFLIHAAGGIGFNTNAPPLGGLGLNGNLVVNGTNVLPFITTGDATLNTKIDLNSVNLTNSIANHSTNDPSGAAAIVNTKLDLNSVNGSNNVTTLSVELLANDLALTNQLIHARAIAGRFTNTLVGVGWGTANFNAVFRANATGYTNLAGNAAITNGVGSNAGIPIYIWTNNDLTIPPIATNGGGAIGTLNFYTNNLVYAGTNITVTTLDGTNRLDVPNTASNTFSGQLDGAQIYFHENITNSGTFTAAAFAGDGSQLTGLNITNLSPAAIAAANGVIFNVTYSTNFLFPPATTPVVTNITINYNTNLYYFKPPSGIAAYTNNGPFIWNTVIGAYTNSTKTAGYVTGDGSLEAGSAPFASLDFSTADYSADTLTNSPWAVENGAAPAPGTGIFGTNSLTTNIVNNLGAITTNRVTVTADATVPFTYLQSIDGIIREFDDAKYLLPTWLSQTLSNSFYFQTNLVAYVSTNGNNSTAIMGDSRFPFATIESAYTAVSNNGCIWFLGIGQSNRLSNLTIDKPVTVVLNNNLLTSTGTPYFQILCNTNLIWYGGELDNIEISPRSNTCSFYYCRIGNPRNAINIDCFVFSGSVSVNNCFLYSKFDAFNNFPPGPSLNVYCYDSFIASDSQNGAFYQSRCIVNKPTTGPPGRVIVKDSTLIAVGSSGSTDANRNLDVTNTLVSLDNVKMILSQTNGYNLRAESGATINQRNVPLLPVQRNQATGTGVINNEDLAGTAAGNISTNGSAANQVLTSIGGVTLWTNVTAASITGTFGSLSIATNPAAYATPATIIIMGTKWTNTYATRAALDLWFIYSDAVTGSASFVYKRGYLSPNTTNINIPFNPLVGIGLAAFSKTNDTPYAVQCLGTNEWIKFEDASGTGASVVVLTNQLHLQ